MHLPVHIARHRVWSRGLGSGVWCFGVLDLVSASWPGLVLSEKLFYCSELVTSVDSDPLSVVCGGSSVQQNNSLQQKAVICTTKNSKVLSK